MKPSITTNMLRSLDLSVAIRLIGNAGFRAVEIEKAHCRRILEAGDPMEECRRARLAAEQAEVTLVQLHALFDLSTDRPLDKTLALAQSTLELSRELGVKWVVLHPASAPGIYEDQRAYTDHTTATREILTELAAIAEDCRVGIAVENLPYHGHTPSFGACVPELTELVDAVGSELIGLCWDTGHAHLAGLDQAKSLRAIGPRLKALHIQDTDTVCDRHWLPMRGEILWQPVMRALADIGYEGAFNLELHGEENVVPLALRESQLRFFKDCADYLLSPMLLEDGFEQRLWTTSGGWSRPY